MIIASDPRIIRDYGYYPPLIGKSSGKSRATVGRPTGLDILYGGLVGPPY